MDIDRRLDRLNKAITLRELELGLAELDNGRLMNLSDAAWLASITDGTLGTVLAVMSVRWASGSSDRMSELIQALTDLRARRLILEEARTLLLTDRS